ncbi:MAG: polysaccharide deacetylase family protein [Candidatus Berkelbacteria bacterium]|nr:polysaccharide deacetylase family protein [Candidatus Berkelbacteria bacterium]
MNKKVWITIFAIVIVVFAVIGGVFCWNKTHKTSADVVPTEKASEPKKELPVIPTITDYKVPILMYHYIRIADEGDELGKNLSVTPTNFASQIKWLKDNNYQTLTLAEFAEKDKKVLSKIIFDKKNPIVLTFDDGYEDAYTEALPVLKENNFTGTFFIIRNSVGKPEYMNQNQINEMEKAGMEIGSHSLSHPNLASLDIASAENQIAKSKLSATTFCYPAGKFDDTTVSLIEKAGYIAAVTTNPGIATQDSNLFELPRLRIFNSDSLKTKLEK